MNTETFANTKFGRIFIRIMAAIMESRFRYRFFGPTRILQGADIEPGQTVLEVGCGTGFFTLPAARLLGEQGSLVAMDILPISVEAVTKRVQTANLKNVRVVQGDALNTQIAAESLDAVLIFGVIPAPMLPMEQLLTEMKRILKPGGTMAVWPPSWVHQTIVQSGLFTFSSKRNSVSNYKRS
ncbi:MAG: class I SAM-dependent methyltransferase [Deltaproteobacteria bacterium]|nr:class I SAM-dependent methyltransferase [Deltaproteobacteria bacterium]